MIACYFVIFIAILLY